jgi:hypothetical protein
MKIALVNYSSPIGWYVNGQKRIVDTMKQHGYNGDMVMLNDNNLFGSPTHQENPYAFKIYAIDYVLEKGYDVVWWMDSSIYPVKNISPVLEIVKEQGYFFESCGFNAAMWTNDKTLDYFGISRDEAEKIILFSAGFMILDFRKEIVREFFARWKNACNAGMFKGSWNNEGNTESNDLRCHGHRHDLSCASIIAYQLNMEIIQSGTYLSYVGEGYGQPKESSIFNLYPAL